MSKPPADLQNLQKQLSKLYSFPIPLALAKVVHFTLETQAETAYQDYYQQAGQGEHLPYFMFGGAALSLVSPALAECDPDKSGRYFNTPLEFFPFGRSGIDGIHFGYVIHAPERPQTDYPVAEFAPIEWTGVIALGHDTKAGFACLMSKALAADAADSNPDALADVSIRNQIIQKLAELLDITPSVGGGRPDPREGRVVPPVPEGWRFLPSQDGVGVLAPGAAFAPQSDCFAHESISLEATLSLIETLLEQHFPATALFVIREFYWRQSDFFPLLAPAWKRIYLALGRPLLADAVEKERLKRTPEPPALDASDSTFGSGSLTGWDIG